MNPLAALYNFTPPPSLNPLQGLELPLAQDGNELNAVPVVTNIVPKNDLPPGVPQVSARPQSPEAEAGKDVSVVTEPTPYPMTGGVGVAPAEAPVQGSAEVPATAYASPSPSAPQIGSFSSALGRVFQFEGGMNSADTNGTPTNFGINQAAHPEVDVKNLTQQQAAGIYKRDYWDAIGADKLPAPIAHLAFDSAVLAGPGEAKKWIAASGGDPAKFMELREGFMNGLLQSNPAKYGKYAKTWASRNATLMADVGLGGTPKPFSPFGTGGQVGGEVVRGDEGGNQGTPSSNSPAIAGAAAGAKEGEGKKGLKDMMTLALLNQMFSNHVFTPVTYDPFKVMPKLEIGENG